MTLPNPLLLRTGRQHRASATFQTVLGEIMTLLIALDFTHPNQAR
jgi:hypothetical protein